MSLRMMSPVAGRVIQVLKDFLFAETTLIDAEENDGLSTPQIAAANFFDFDLKSLPQFPACTIQSVSSAPIDVKPDAFGQRIEADHRIIIKFHVAANVSADLRTLEKLTLRYVAGAVRVLALVKWGLQTAGDPVEWGSPLARTLTRWTDAATYTQESDQGDGSVVRTANLPMVIKRVEARV